MVTSRLKMFAIIAFLAAIQLTTSALAQVPHNNRYGVIVAVDEYSTGLTNVKYAREDARLIEQLFERVLHIPRKRIEVYDSDITKLRLEKIFDDLGEQISGDDAELFVYFVGHGSKAIVDPATNIARGYLLARDTPPEELNDRSAYPYETLLNTLTNLRSTRFPNGHVYLLLESCFSGQFSDGTAAVPRNTMAAASGGGDPFEIEAEKERAGLSVISAATGDQVAYWDDELEHGVFSFYLAAGLAGFADGNIDGRRDGQVSAGELGQYLGEKVWDGAKSVNPSAKQTPVLDGMNPDEILSAFSVDAPPRLDDLEEVRIAERQMTELVIADDVTRMTVPELRAKLQEIRERLSHCFGCETEDGLIQYRDAVEERSNICGAEQRVYRRLASSSKFPELKAAVEKSRCKDDHLTFQATACASTKDNESKACSCLAEDNCQDLRDPQCAPAFAAAKSQAVAERILSPLSQFKQDHKDCPEVEQLVDVQAEVCRAAAEPLLAGKDIAGHEKFLADLRDCEQAADIEKHLQDIGLANAGEVCVSAWEGVSGQDLDGTQLERFLRERRNCPQTEEALKRLAGLADTIWQEANSQAQAGDSKAAQTKLDGFLERFGEWVSAATRVQFEDRIAGLGNDCETAFNQAKRANSATDLERFVRDKRTCPEVNEANRILASIYSCDTAWQSAQRSRDPDELRAFPERYPECPAPSDLPFLVRKAECSLAWDNVRYQTNPGDLYSFRDGHGDCPAETREADARLEQLFQSCMGNGERAEAESADRARVAYDVCLGDFRRDARKESMVLAALNALPADIPSIDGLYNGTRGYTDSGRPSRNKLCLGTYRFTATVRNGSITFSSDDRTWRGSVDEHGSIDIDINGISPAPKQDTYIQAQIDAATGAADGTLWNGFCGSGYFRLERR